MGVSILDESLCIYILHICMLYNKCIMFNLNMFQTEKLVTLIPRMYHKYFNEVLSNITMLGRYILSIIYIYQFITVKKMSLVINIT